MPYHNIGMVEDRIIGRLKGNNGGKMLIVIGGIHGNEHAGVTAITRVFQKLQKEIADNGNFQMKGSVIGLIGNRRAWEKSQRFIVKDLNRQWETENIHRIVSSREDQLDEEDLEVKGLLETINTEINQEKPTQLVILDLHTTSADGGVFLMVDDRTDSLKIAMGVGEPVIKGMYEILSGTTLRFFNSENFGLPTTTIAFEAGQHDDPHSVAMSESAIYNILEICGIIHQIPNKINPKQKNVNPPLVAEITYTHHIKPEDDFFMKPGYQNFQQLSAGEVIAFDKKGEICVPYDCRILMPLYQEYGSEGFFLIREIPIEGL